jgi:hypothetical protein
MSKFFQVTTNVIINIDCIHSIQMNKDGQRGWIRMNKEINGKLIMYPITLNQYIELHGILIGGPLQSCSQT